MFICLIKNGRQTQKLDRGLQTSNSALRRRAKEGNLCGARYNILVVLFWLNKADLDVVFSYSFRSNAFLLGKKKKNLLDALKALSITYQSQCLPFKVGSPVDITTSLGA